MDLAMLLQMLADGAPERPVLGPTGSALTAADLSARARQAAGLVRSRGVEHVGLVDLNSEAVPVCLFGAAMAGVPFAPVNYRLTDDRLRAVVSRLAPGLVVVGSDVAGRIGPVEGIEMVERDAFLQTVAQHPPLAEGEFVDPDEIAVLLFTSGTTGEPKAAVLRHRHLTSYIITTVEFMGADDDEAQLISVPAYHVAGISAVLSCLYSGRRIVYLPGFAAEDWLDTVEGEGITQAMVVPTMLGRVLDLMEQRGTKLSSLRHLSYGGGRMPVELVERAMTMLPGVNFVNAYGLTETSSTITVLGPEDHRQALATDDPATRRRLASVGRPLPTVELEIRGPDGGQLAPGQRGEIHVRGEQVAGEYLGRSALTSDGWFPTNDAGYLDEDGFLFLEGRLDDVIVRGAENLSPGEIEDTLRAHPAVAEAAVVGIPDPEWGEAVAAAVVLGHDRTATVPELQDWVRQRLRSTKTPQVIRFRSELPYNETGKLLRRVLRDELAAPSGGASE
jgi:fatty-acyl-CoA synthase